MKKLHGLFDEAKRLNGSLTDGGLKKLIDAMYAYVIGRFGTSPSSKDISCVCIATLTLFPYYEVTPSIIGGIVSFR